jgi:hypothetical protein
VTTPTRPRPVTIERWTSRLRWLRGVDAVAAWLAALLAIGAAVPGLPPQSAAIVAIALVVAAALVPRLRLGWRPVSAAVGLRLSRDLRPGHRAWLVHAGGADLVLVTARRGWRVVIARPGHDAAEGMSVRRTRVLLLPAEV